MGSTDPSPAPNRPTPGQSGLLPRDGDVDARPQLAVMTVPPLGRLQPVPPREVWAHEAQHFTPWLLQNADVLSDLLGMELELEVAEHPVGGFSLDLLGKDTLTGQVVIVENQLETTDHSHLGQILTYAAGTDPTTIVWVAASFRPEHRSALDWLNERTDENTRFFGVEVGVVRIGDSTPAPAFRLVTQPNDWQKTVRAATTQAGVVSRKGELYRAFWSRWLAMLQGQRPGWSRATRAPVDSWFSMTTGTMGATYYTAFTRRGLSSQLVFEDPDPEVNQTRFDAVVTRLGEMAATYVGTLDFEPLPGRKSTRIAEYLPDADVAREKQWDTYLTWLLERQTSLRAALAAIGGVPPTTADVSGPTV